MSDYLEVVQFKQQNGKWRAQRLGSAKKNDKGQLNVYLDALPIPDAEGNVRLTIQERQERDGGESYKPSGGSAPATGGVPDLDDAIPFAPAVL